MKIRLVVPDEHLSAEILDPALEAVTRANEALIHAGKVPLFEEALKAGKVKWKPEPAGQKFEAFDLATTVLDRGWGDCDDLAPWAAASHRASGKDPHATAFAHKSKRPGLWHANMKHGDGTINDPSCAAGMKCDPQGATPINAPMHKLGRAALATLPWGGRTAARFDLPWDGSHYALSGHAVSESPQKAIVQAIRAALHTGAASGAVHPHYLTQGMALEEAIAGHGDADEIAYRMQALGMDGEAAYQAVGSLWGSIKKAAHAVSHVVPIKTLVHFAAAPITIAKAQAKAALAMSKALATGHPGDAAKAMRNGLNEITSNPAFQTAMHVAPVIPGLGPSVAAGMNAAAAFGAGHSVLDSATAGVRQMVPPGPAQGAFDAAVGLAHGGNLSSAAMYAARQSLPPELRPHFDQGLGAASKATRSMPTVMSPMIVRLL